MKGPTLIPIKTHIITPADDLHEVVRRYAAALLRPGDTLAITSKIVAITQGRILRPTQVEPGWLARLASRFVPEDGSLSSMYSLQAVIDEVGALRIGVACGLAAVTRLLGRRGDFYRVAGLPARVIDDVSGTMAPFDKHIVLAPQDPEGVARRLGEAFGVEVAIIDANDLGAAEILGATAGVDRPLIEGIFRGNPWGNGHQQIPLMVVRPAGGR